MWTSWSGQERSPTRAVGRYAKSRGEQDQSAAVAAGSLAAPGAGVASSSLGGPAFSPSACARLGDERLDRAGGDAHLGRIVRRVAGLVAEVDEPRLAAARQDVALDVVLVVLGLEPGAADLVGPLADHLRGRRWPCSCTRGGRATGPPSPRAAAAGGRVRRRRRSPSTATSTAGGRRARSCGAAAAPSCSAAPATCTPSTVAAGGRPEKSISASWCSISRRLVAGALV